MAIVSTHLLIEYQVKLRCMCFVMVARRKFRLGFSVTGVQSNYKIQSNQFLCRWRRNHPSWIPKKWYQSLMDVQTKIKAWRKLKRISILVSNPVKSRCFFDDNRFGNQHHHQTTAAAIHNWKRWINFSVSQLVLEDPKCLFFPLLLLHAKRNLWCRWE